MTEIFFVTLSQITFLVCLIAIGFILVRVGIVKDEAADVLAKLETYLFCPAVVMQSAMQNFTVEKLKSAGILFILGFVITMAIIPFAIVLARVFTKDAYLQNIYKYAFTFGNFGYMGNAVVLALFPEYFFEYVMFTLPLYVHIFAWIIPSWLLADADAKPSVKERIKNIVNPMFVALIIGIIIGIAKISVPMWLDSVVSASANCMSPIAMLLTGIAVAGTNLKSTFKNVSVYTVSFIRLIVIPLVFIGVLYILNPSKVIVICAMVAFSMPLGLNTIIFPRAHGRDTSVATGLTVVSHLLSCVTIPIIFAIVNRILL